MGAWTTAQSPEVADHPRHEQGEVVKTIRGGLYDVLTDPPRPPLELPNRRIKEACDLHVLHCFFFFFDQ
ncbi:hypothetical protein QJS04_geneDACA017384 [Acorus gramineus]|uniref:Uncharacterized protein n=1 Tax=Acorus gramineus TaxID=55184 RepID=A0AAV9A1B5_ACOGR|nr:hypothetical protein QJS04_geneDACA017384 [Acorus gramineus]